MNTQSTVPTTFGEYIELHPYQYSVSYTRQDHYTDMWEKWEKLTKEHEVKVHLNHCYQGEYEDGCKYGEDNCPAKPKEDPVSVSVEEAAKLRYPDCKSTADQHTIDMFRSIWINGAKFYEENFCIQKK